LRVPALEAEVDAIAAETQFSGVVRVDRGGRIEVAKAYGLAHRGYEIANAVDTQFGIASGTKGFTALAVVRLIEDGLLELSTPARSVLGRDLPLVGDDVTVEHLLSHRSGIGDYLDEEVEQDPSEYAMSVPAHELAATEDYLIVLDGHPRKFAAGERFAYCNSGYVVLALIAERVSGTPFDELVRQRVCKPARMHHTGFIRSDELPRARRGRVHRGGRCRENERVPPARARQRRRRHLLDGGRHRLVLERALCGADRVDGVGPGSRAPSQRSALEARPVRPRLLARRCG
jgi:CubicO group peptidase (beta-lactamase class C family)